MEDDKKIEKIISGFTCPKDFRCCKAGFKNLCKAKDVGIESYLKCLDDNPRDCPFAVPYGYTAYYCECPLRVYIAKKLKK
jgi:hypothetical protein